MTVTFLDSVEKLGTSVDGKLHPLCEKPAVLMPRPWIHGWPSWTPPLLCARCSDGSLTKPVYLPLGLISPHLDSDQSTVLIIQPKAPASSSVIEVPP